MSTMIERVVEALTSVRTDREQVWLMHDDEQWRAWALAAIVAMRKPTEAMRLLGEKTLDQHCTCDEEIVWRTMIDAALSEGLPTPAK